ncbi:hypothetical protein Acry_3154 (plasmid) [Acidiphilium cryptum JF-5]|uniref:Uncharacterized protein n=1 Tax=Acidiphilium cryptum (strain JF-5) TaxID=349163 RepID=A5FT47_ACICJ|nr:hypothetical protein Acry_3154 [Acidiphilium cryptum JF-5]
MRRLVGARSQLIGISIDVSNQIRSTLKTFGLRATGGAGCVFEAKVRIALEGRPEVAGVVEPLLAAWRAVRDQIAVLDRKLMAAVKADPTCRLLITRPGVGVVVAASFSAAVDQINHTQKTALSAAIRVAPADDRQDREQQDTRQLVELPFRAAQIRDFRQDIKQRTARGHCNFRIGRLPKNPKPRRSVTPIFPRKSVGTAVFRIGLTPAQKLALNSPEESPASRYHCARLLHDTQYENDNHNQHYQSQKSTADIHGFNPFLISHSDYSTEQHGCRVCPAFAGSWTPLPQAVGHNCFETQRIEWNIYRECMPARGESETTQPSQLDTRINPVKVVEFVIMGWPAPLVAIG